MHLGFSRVQSRDSLTKAIAGYTEGECTDRGELTIVLP